MRAEIKDIESALPRSQQISLVFKQMTPIYVEPRQTTKRYKKVGKEVKAKLLRCIQKGWSIINVRIYFIP